MLDKLFKISMLLIVVLVTMEAINVIKLTGELFK